MVNDKVDLPFKNRTINMDYDSDHEDLSLVNKLKIKMNVKKCNVNHRNGNNHGHLHKANTQELKSG
jgi:hypothetical protein